MEKDNVPQVSDASYDQVVQRQEEAGRVIEIS